MKYNSLDKRTDEQVEVGFYIVKIVKKNLGPIEFTRWGFRYIAARGHWVQCFDFGSRGDAAKSMFEHMATVYDRPEL